jgi:hypothetical protein
MVYEGEILPGITCTTFEIRDYSAEERRHVQAVTAVAEAIVNIFEFSSSADSRRKIERAVDQAAPRCLKRNSRQPWKNSD